MLCALSDHAIRGDSKRMDEGVQPAIRQPLAAEAPRFAGSAPHRAPHCSAGISTLQIRSSRAALPDSELLRRVTVESSIAWRMPPGGARAA